MSKVIGSKSLEVLPPRIVALFEETNAAWTTKELTERFGYTDASIVGVLFYMEATGVIEKRRFRSNFYFLKDKYSDAEIKKIIEQGYLRRYKIKSRRAL